MWYTFSGEEYSKTTILIVLHAPAKKQQKHTYIILYFPTAVVRHVLYNSSSSSTVSRVYEKILIQKEGRPTCNFVFFYSGLIEPTAFLLSLLHLTDNTSDVRKLRASLARTRCCQSRFVWFSQSHMFFFFLFFVCHFSTRRVRSRAFLRTSTSNKTLNYAKCFFFFFNSSAYSVISRGENLPGNNERI